MKLIIAYLRPEQLPAVKSAMAKAEIKQFTAMTALGTAPKSEQRIYRGVEREVSLFNRLRLEVAVSEEQVENAVEAISAGAKDSGGHGRIMVTGLDDVVTVWTGDRGEESL